MTKSTVTSLRFTSDQYEKIKKLADLHGVSVTTYMREAVLDRMTDEVDYNDANANLTASHGKTVSSAAIRQRLGLDR